MKTLLTEAMFSPDVMAMTAAAMKQEILNSYTASYWLKERVKGADRRDILDIKRDTETLLLYLNKKWDSLSG